MYSEDIDIKDLEKYFIDNNEKKFKALQVYEWLYDKRVSSFFEMSNIKKELQEKLNNDFSMKMIKIQKKQEDNLTKLIDGHNKILVIIHVFSFHKKKNALRAF